MRNWVKRAAVVTVFIALFAMAWRWTISCDPPYHSGAVYCDSKLVGDQLR